MDHPPPDFLAPSRALKSQPQTFPNASAPASPSSSTSASTASPNVNIASTNRGIGPVSLNGSQSVSPTTTYILTVANSNGNSASCSTNTAAMETTSRSVVLTSLAAGSTVGEISVALSATSSDIVGVAGVQFKLDGANIGFSGTTSPYSITWNSTSVADGSHTIAARCQ
jgi:Bacterial Ig domain